MSRIGKKPIPVPKGVQVTLKDGLVEVKGPKGQLSQMLPPGVNAWNDISNNEAFLAGTLGITQNAGTMLAKAYFDKVPHAESIFSTLEGRRRSSPPSMFATATATLEPSTPGAS